VRRSLPAVLRAALAVVVALLVLALLRWSPVYAETPLPVRALPLAGPAVALAVLVALTARERPAPRLRGLVIALVALTAALTALVVIRPAAGLPAEVSDGSTVVGRLPPGPVEVSGPLLRELPPVRRWTFRWAGPLRAGESGTYRLWVAGRGRVEVRLDGRPALVAEGDPLKAGADVGLAAGEHRLEVTLQRTGPGPRLRLGWSHGATDEMIPPRHLGPSSGNGGWRLTDVLAFAVAALAGALVFVAPWERPRARPAPSPVTRREIGLSLAGHAALAALMSWPLVLDLAHAGVTDRPDGRLNAWILAWDAHALLHQPARFFQAPIFHPLPDSLALSENLILPAVLSAPLQWLGGPVLAYNAVLLVSMIVSGLGAQLLVRRASGDRFAAFVGGAMFAVGAHRWIRLAHLHAQVTTFLPFALIALDRFWAKRTLRRALAVGLLLALQALSSIYLGAITALALASAIGVGLFAGLKARDLLRLAAGGALAALILLPVARPYMRMRSFYGVEWSMADVATYATTLESYAAAGTRLYGPIGQRHLDPERVQDTLFPGLTVLVLGLAGLAVAPRRYRAVAVVASALAILVSLGPQTALYRVLHENLVLVRGVRALSRFSLLPVLCLDVLAGLALSGRRHLLAAAALLLMLAESSNVPIRYGTYDGPPEWSRWLAGRPGAVAVLPLGEGDTQAMLDGTAHFRPLVNGDSGFVPRPYTRAMELLQEPLGSEALRLLRAVGVSEVVSTSDLPLPVEARFFEAKIYAVPSGPAAAPVAFGDAVPSVWSSEGITIDLGEPRVVGRVAFELSDADWIERPRVAVSTDKQTWTEVDATASLADATLSLMRDPRHGRGEVSFAPQDARYVRLDARLPARAGALEAGP
jgi:F5/8 type C domain-containing protein